MHTVYYSIRIYFLYIYIFMLLLYIVLVTAEDRVQAQEGLYSDPVWNHFPMFLYS